MLIKLPVLGVLTVNRKEMTKNFVFREFECGLSIEE
ncbi:regulator, partial [Vibrio cholerae]